MSVKLADTLAPMGEFPVAEGKDIILTKTDGIEKSIQKMYDDGELSGDLTQFIGTKTEWDVLSDTEKEKYAGKEVIIIDDNNEETLSVDIIDDYLESAKNKTYSIDKIKELQVVNLITDPYFVEEGKDHRGVRYTINKDRSINVSTVKSTTTPQEGKYSYYDINRRFLLERNKWYTLTLEGGVGVFSAIYFTDAGDINVTCDTTYIRNGQEITEVGASYVYGKDDNEIAYNTVSFKVDADNVYAQFQIRALRNVAIECNVYPMLEVGKVAHSFVTHEYTSYNLGNKIQKKNLIEYPFKEKSGYTNRGITFTYGEDGIIHGLGTTDATLQPFITLKQGTGIIKNGVWYTLANFGLVKNGAGFLVIYFSTSEKVAKSVKVHIEYDNGTVVEREKDFISLNYSGMNHSCCFYVEGLDDTDFISIHGRYNSGSATITKETIKPVLVEGTELLKSFIPPQPAVTVNSYSEEEINTHQKWIDGKDIYRKVLTSKVLASDNVPNTRLLIKLNIDATNISQFIIIKGIIKVKGINKYIECGGTYYIGDEPQLATTMAYDGSDVLLVLKNGTVGVEWMINQDLELKAIVEYTKTTD